MKKQPVKKTLEQMLIEAAELLAADVRADIGTETLARLADQPLAIAAGGIEVLLKDVCKKCAGRANALNDAVRMLRVACGSKGEKNGSSESLRR